jgi:hypothetical protein
MGICLAQSKAGNSGLIRCDWVRLPGEGNLENDGTVALGLWGGKCNLDFDAGDCGLSVRWSIAFEVMRGEAGE